MLKEILIFTGGTVVGFLAGTYYYKKSKCQKCKEMHEKDMQDMKEYYEGKHPEKPPYDNGTTTIDIKSMNSEYVKPNKVDYTKFYDPAEDEHPSEEAGSEENVDDNLGELLTDEYKANRGKPPKIIKVEEYGNNDAYKEMSLLYYQENDILVVEEGDVEEMLYPDEIDDYIGDALIKFGFATNDERKIFVRNFSQGIDFQITKVFGAFEG